MTLSYAEQLDLMINSDFDTLYGFIGLCTVSFIASVLGIIMVKYLFDALWYIAKNLSFKHFDEKADILTRSTDTFENESNESTLRLFKATKRLAFVVVAFEFIGTAFVTLFPSLVQSIVTEIPDKLKALRAVISNVIPSLWSIDLILRVIIVICACVLITRMRDGYKNINYLE